MNWSNRYGEQRSADVGSVIDVEFTHNSKMLVSFDSGHKLEVELEGDCCSSSVFTADAMQDAKELIGSKIIEVENRDSGGRAGRKYPSTEGEYLELSWHFLVFTTDRGHVTLDWRNESNGYYDGWPVLQLVAP